MNPFKLLGLANKASKATSIFERAAKDWDTRRTAAERQRALYAQTSWWIEALTAARDLALVLPLPSSWIRRLQVKNWKTTLAGISALLAVAVKVVNGSGVGAEDIAIITGALGLLFAKDGNVTGGTKPATEEAKARTE